MFLPGDAFKLFNAPYNRTKMPLMVMLLGSKQRLARYTRTLLIFIRQTSGAVQHCKILGFNLISLVDLGLAFFENRTA